MPAPFRTSSCAPIDTLSSSLTPPTSAANTTAANKPTNTPTNLPANLPTNLPDESAATTLSVRFIAAPQSNRSQSFENTRGAHAGPDAHGYHPVFLLAASQAMHDGCRADRARGAQRMAERDRATERIHLCRVELELLHDRK